MISTGCCVLDAAYQAIGGMRGIKGMLWETSLLDPEEVSAIYPVKVKCCDYSYV